MAYSHADRAIARCLGPVASGSLAINAGRGAAFAAAAPSPSTPLALGLWRSPSPPALDVLEPDGTEILIGAVLVTAVTVDALAVAGAVPGYTLPTIQPGDWIADAPLAAHFTGLQGPPGADGATGATGPKGEPGEQGPPGATGPKGDKGDAGADGAQGLKGDKGDPGETGPTGSTATALICLGRWYTPSSGPAALGDMTGRPKAPVACALVKVVLSAEVNPAGVGGGASVQLKVGGSNRLSTALALPAGSLGPVEATSFSNAAVASLAEILPSLVTAIGGDVRGLLVEVWAREVV